MLGKAGLLLVSVGLSATAQAQSVPSQDALNWMRIRMSEHVRQRPYLWSREQIAVLMEPQFVAMSDDGMRITRERRERLAKAALAQTRANRMQQFLAADIEGTGRIDRPALRRVLARSLNGVPRVSPPSAEMAVERYFEQADTDGDGFVTYEEAVRGADSQAAATTPNGASEAIPTDLDLDGDDVITIEEFRTVLQTVYDEIDTERDNRLTQTEVTRFQAETLSRASREAQLRSQRLAAMTEARTKGANCDIPAWDANTILSAVLATDGRAMAALSIGEGTGTLGAVNVHVEPGEKPVSVVLQSSGPILWQFTGDVSRVAVVFVSQHEASNRSVSDDPDGSASAKVRRRPGSGVAGIASEKVRFAAHRGCLPLGGGRDEFVRDQLAAALGREPNTIVGPERMTTARLPSGTALDNGSFPNIIEGPTDSPGGPLWAMLKRSKRPLVHVQASAVTAAFPVRSAPLPGLAGLAAMVDDGRAKIAGWRTVTRIMGPRGQDGLTIIGGSSDTLVVGPHVTPNVTREPSELLVLAPITLPPGLEKSDLDRLIVARGVQAPSGERDAICIVREEDGKPVDGSRCR